MTCRCSNVAMGTYAAQVTCELPFPTPKFPDGGKFVGIDHCILPTIVALWNEGIETIESCCGHGQPVGYIAVVPEHEPAMQALGYRRDPRAPHVFIWPLASCDTRRMAETGNTGSVRSTGGAVGEAETPKGTNL